ncbi:MAG: T9SS type A sorting domain-containing protein [Bacteroidota bacterium]
MKNVLKFYLTATVLSLFTYTASYGVARSWVGQGSGGAGTDFNTGTNWSPAGVPTAADDLTMTFTSTCTITLSANISCNNLTVNGNACVNNRIRVMGFTLTVNGIARFNANNYCSPVSYNVIQLDAVNGSWVFNGDAYIHNSGNGNTYIMANSISPGDMIFRGSLVRFGQYAQTQPGTEPDLVFDRAGAMTINCRNTTYHVKGESITFGLTNSPTVTITGVGASGMFNFQPYDGNLTIGANTTVSIRDTTVINSSTTLQRYVGGGGTFTMGAGSTLNYGGPNILGGFTGYATYSLNATSTVNYASRGWQDMQPITYGHVICNGLANTGMPDKYSNGAQTMQGNLTIQNYAEYVPWSAGGLTVNGNTLIQTNGVFNATRNNAVANITHTFQGNFTNNASFTSGTPVGVNTALFNGTGNQTIGGTVSTNFYNLTCNKASGTLFLGINTTVGTGTAGVMAFTAGPLNLNAFTLIINNPAAGAVTRTSGYAISENTSNLSKIQWNMGSTTGAHVFPFGTAGGTYIPFTFNLTAGTIGNVTISTYPTAPDNTPWPTTPTPVTNLNSVTGLTCSYTSQTNNNCNATVDRFWQIDKTGPTGTATMTFSYAATEIGNAPYNVASDQRVQRWNSGTSKWEPALGGQTTAGNSVTVPGVTTFSPWGMASQLSPLPISLTHFDAQPQASAVLVSWTTESEINNDYFIVERTTDGSTYEEVAIVDSKAPGGNSTERLSYTSLDTDPVEGLAYYRLKQVDHNGRFSYSHLVAVNFSTEVYDLLIAPNPANDKITVCYNSAAERAGTVIRIYDVTGRMVASHTVNSVAGINTVIIDVSAFMNGMYFIDVSDQGKNGKTKFIKD